MKMFKEKIQEAEQQNVPVYIGSKCPTILISYRSFSSMDETNKAMDTLKEIFPDFRFQAINLSVPSIYIPELDQDCWFVKGEEIPSENNASAFLLISEEKQRWLERIGAIEFKEPIKYVVRGRHLYSEKYIQETPLYQLKRDHSERIKNEGSFLQVFYSEGWDNE